jgi:hypothetical protein
MEKIAKKERTDKQRRRKEGGGIEVVEMVVLSHANVYNII